jgi:hypothetical protein
MKIGVVINQPKPMEGFDLTFYHVKQVSGKINKAAADIYNIVSCFGDNKTARGRSEWIALSKQGKAVRSNRIHRFCWDWICPSVKEYRVLLLNLLEEISKIEVTGIHLDCVHFPRREYCICRRCKEDWKESGLDWVKWRCKVINDFLRRASKLVSGNLSICLMPDPYYSKEQFGLDFHSLERYVDFFVVPLYDLAYLTTYWMEILAYGFRKRVKKPLYIELYAGHPKITTRNLLRAIIAMSSYADGIILATYDVRLAEKFREKLEIDRLREELEREL